MDWKENNNKKPQEECLKFSRDLGIRLLKATLDNGKKIHNVGS